MIGKTSVNITLRSGGYGDVTATYIRRSEIPSRIYAKHQYRQESEYGSKWCIIHSNIWVQLQSYHQRWSNITWILHHQKGAIARVQKYTYINSQKALTSLQKWNSRGTQGAWKLSLIHIWRCRRSTLCRSRWSPYH